MKRFDFMRLFKAISLYLIISIVTTRFAGSFWLGETPILAIVQHPILIFAGWLRTSVVMPLIRAFGLSAGSFSPDFAMARPYGLLLCFAIPAVILAGFLASSLQSRWASWRWFLIVVGLMAIDGLTILNWGQSRLLTIY